MPYFSVVSDELALAGGQVATRSSALASAYGTMAGDTGALEGTPATFAYATFLTSVQDATTAAHEAVDQLGTALQEAATAYAAADSSAASSFVLGQGG